MPRPVRLGQHQGVVFEASSDHTKTGLCPGRETALRNLLSQGCLCGGRGQSPEPGLPVWGPRPRPATRGCAVVSRPWLRCPGLSGLTALSPAECSRRLSWVAVTSGAQHSE